MKVINHFWRQFDVWFCISVASDLKIKPIIMWNSIYLFDDIFLFISKVNVVERISVIFHIFSNVGLVSFNERPVIIYDKNTLWVSWLITPFWWVRNQICWIPSSNYWGVKLMLIISTMLSMSCKMTCSSLMKSEIQIKYDFWNIWLYDDFQ